MGQLKVRYDVREERRHVGIPMRTRTFYFLPLFLVLNGDLFRIHGEGRFAAEGRTKVD